MRCKPGSKQPRYGAFWLVDNLYKQGADVCGACAARLRQTFEMFWNAFLTLFR